MAVTLYFHVPPNFSADKEQKVNWFDTEDQSTGSGELGQLAEKALGHRVVVLVPAVDVVLLEAEVPTKNRQRLLKALPYALEEQFADEVESLHFAIGPQLESGKVTVAVVARERMQQWQEAFYQAGIEPQSMIPESLAIPKQGDDWSLLTVSGMATLRTGFFVAGSSPAGEVDTLCRLALEQNDKELPRCLHYFSFEDDEQCDDKVKQCCLDAGIELSVESGEKLLSFYHRGINENSIIDLMQGEFSRKERLGRYWRPWRGAAAMLLLLVLLQATMAVYDYITLSRQEQQLSQQIEQLYRDTFPDARKVVNPRLQMEQRLKALQQGSNGDGFVSLLSLVGPVLQRAASLEMEAMRYRQSSLELDIRIKDFQALDELKASLLNNGGVTVTITTANAEGGKVRSQLRIQGSDA